MNTSKRGLEIWKHDPNIDEFIEYEDESIPVEELPEFWKKQEEEFGADKYINFSGSLECNVALHPRDPEYAYPKYERAELCDKNYYDVTAEWAGVKCDDQIPSLYFTKKEHKAAKKFLKKDKFNILWGMSGSGKNKVYPWTEYVIGEILNNYDNVHFITVGDEKCQLIESRTDNITNLSGKLDIRTTLCLTGHVDLVVSPDTGVLHASGCYTTPKIGLLGHTTKNNITKYFVNDNSIEAKCGCAPCFHLIYDYNIQCPTDPITKAAWCMAVGLEPERVYEQVASIIPDSYRRQDIS